MKILQINNNHYRAGGAETVYFNTISLLRKYGHEVISFSRKSSQAIKTNENEYFVDFNTNLFSRFYYKSAVRELNKVLDKDKPDIVHIHRVIGGITFSILPLLKKYEVPVVMTIHDFRMLCPVTAFMNKSGDICEKCLGGKYFNCIIQNCSPEGVLRSISITAESYLRDLFIPYEKYVDQFIFVSDFSKNKFFEVNNNLRDKSLRLYNFTEKFQFRVNSGKYFLYLGRLSREKGIYTLLSAFNSLPQINIKIIGDGELKSAIERYKLKNVELLGYKEGDELNELINHASFVIIPSECYENNPMSIIESFAHGKPVIGTNVGGIPEIVEENKTGFLYAPKDHNSLAKKIILADQLSKDEYSKMSSNAYNYAIEHFSPEKHYKNLLDVYERVLSRK